MGYVFVTIGLLAIITGVRDTYKQFGALLVGDFTGPGNFTYWVAAIGFVGAIGYAESLKTFSRAFLFLILIGMILRNGGVFDKLTQALKQGPEATAPASTLASTTGTAGNSAASMVHDAAQIAQAAAQLAVFI